MEGETTVCGVQNVSTDVDGYREEECRETRKSDLVLLRPGDVVAKFDKDCQIVLGKVLCHVESLDVRVEWDDNTFEAIPRTKEGKLDLPRQIGVLDRSGVTGGVEVTDGRRRGRVRQKRCLATVSLNESPDVLVEDVPVESLVRPAPMKMDVKVLYRNEWIGLVVHTKSRVHFKVEKDDKIGWLDDDGFNSNEPIPGEKIPKLSISMLWDTHWASASDHWLWNLVKYLADSATVLRTETYRLNIAWMGRVDKQIMDTDDPTPPNDIEGLETVSEVQLLYGRNETYTKQHDVWMYTLKEGDTPLTYDSWTRKLQNGLFAGPQGPEWGDEASGDKLEMEELNNIFSRKDLQITVVSYRNVVDVDWDDGTSGAYEMIDVWPANNFLSKFKVGDIVKEYGVAVKSMKYGFVESIERRGMLKVKWVDPSTNSYAPLVFTTPVSQFDLALVEQWECLRSLQDCPLVVSNAEVVSSFMRVGVLVGVSVPDAKIVVRFSDGIERPVWAHSYPRFKGDIQFNYDINIWTSWNSPEEKEYALQTTALPADPVYEICTAMPHFRLLDRDPTYNMFCEGDFLPRYDDAKFQTVLMKELEYLKEILDADKDVGLWIESYFTRPDLFTAILVGPYGTIYEGHLFVLDFILPYDYPESPIRVKLNTQDKSLSNRIFSCGCENGVLTIPPSVASRWEQKSTILNIISYVRDVVMKNYKIPPEELSSERFNQQQNNSMYLSVLEYTDALLRYPHPDILNTDRFEFMKTYFATVLHELIESSEEYLATCDEKLCFKDDAGDGSLCGFTISLKIRIEKLREFLPGLIPM